MRKIIFLLVCLAWEISLSAQTLSVKMEELTAPDFLKALQKSDSTCVIPIGVLEKHGPHLPLGTDIIDVREIVLRAAANEYVVVFPSYIFSQIFEARHQPGTIAYSADLIWKVLQETCDELGRNGFNKIILVSGHGGNNNFLPYFCQAQLAQRKSYTLINYSRSISDKYKKEIEAETVASANGHAGQTETSVMLAHRPDLVKMDQAKAQSGEDQNHITGVDSGYTGIWWYGKYPNHYAGDGSIANKEFGELLLKNDTEQLESFLKDIKANSSILKYQDEFYKKADNPLKTKQ